MRHWFVLAAIYALVAALIVPGPLGAQEEPPSTTTESAETVPAEDAPDGSAPVETVPVEPTPAPVEPAPAEPAPAAPAPVETVPVPAEPAPAPAAEEAPVTEPAEPTEPPKERRSKRKPLAVAAATQNVTIVDFEFTPATITVQQGDTVTWTNEGPTPHSATASDGSFDTGIFSAGGSRSQTFDQAGTFAYICTPHPNMTGTVVVEASTSGGSGGEGSGDGSTDTGSTDSGSTTGGTASGSTSSGAGLPATGADALLLAIIGVLMLALGLVLQRRSETARNDAAGRIGW